MSIYLHDIPLPEAQKRLKQALKEAGLWKILSVEEIPLSENASGRVLAEPIWAKISSPHYHASAMDGFAVRARETEGAIPSSPISLVYHRQTVYIDTGDPLPAWADAVIPIENVEAITENEQPSSDPRYPYAIRIRAAIVPWQHVRPMGEDIVATQLVLPSGHILRPVDLGAIAASGYNAVKVAQRPKVAVLPTGSELVPIGQSVKAGDIIEYNSLVIAAQVNSWGGEVNRFPIIPDNFETIQKVVLDASQSHDLILLNAGSSAGSEDFSKKVVESLGTLLVHGVAVRPGHPVIIGLIKKSHNHDVDAKVLPIIGVPGYPVSAALTCEIFVEPLLACWLGRSPSEPIIIKATLMRKIISPPGDDDYIRVNVGKVGERVLAASLSRGAGVITSLVRADGITIIPRGSQGLSAGETVDVRLYCSPNELDKTIFATGSHDITLDLMAQFIANRERKLVSANVGSLGGLIALQRGEAHLAGSHLLDPQTGEYNLSFIQQYLPDIPVKIIGLVLRQQGLLINKGNPKQIQDLHDLSRSDICFINRQRGAGTRVLLDYHLGLLNIDPRNINGYAQEEYTHLSIAAAIASGRADCGLGIAAAAQALNLDFIPLFQERYELVILKEYTQNPLLTPLIELLSDIDFRKAVASLEGYDISPMGELIAEVG
jgi:putative molybdopterin biosynthesis protein